jgi:hypothetical protein
VERSEEKEKDVLRVPTIGWVQPPHCGEKTIFLLESTSAADLLYVRRSGARRCAHWQLSELADSCHDLSEQFRRLMPAGSRMKPAAPRALAAAKPCITSGWHE